MAFSLDIQAFDALPAGEQVQIVMMLWERVATQPERLEVSEAQRRELARRVAAHDADASAAIPWDELEAELLGTG